MDGWRRSRGRLPASRAGTTPAAAGVGLLVALLTGCAGAWPFGLGETAETCVSWAGMPDDESRADVASVVVDGRILETAGDRPMFGTRATVWQVEVVAVVKGDLAVGEVVEIASTPQTCSGATYPDGDPLGDVAGVARLYLHDSDFAIAGTEAGLALISPFDGVAEPPT